MSQGARGRVQLDGLVKRFGETTAVSGVSADIPPGTFFALLGPSGCGKSTLLRMIAGLEPPTEGAIRVDGRDITALPAQRRPTAMVFQSYALFPSMTVEENVEYGLRVRRVPKGQRQARTRDALDLVGMSALGQRSVAALSGGQQQRVALARALVVEPEVMLFDEPLSNLDVALRERTRGELRALQRSLGTTSVYVTHDQEEAMAVSDLMAVMRDGGFVQVGPPEQLYREPDTAYVAQFLGGSNIISDAGLAGRLASAPGTGVLSVRPEDLVPADDGPIEGRITERQFLGSHTEWTVSHGEGTVRVRQPSSVNLSDDTRLAARASRWVKDDR